MSRLSELVAEIEALQAQIEDRKQQIVAWAVNGFTPPAPEPGHDPYANARAELAKAKEAAPPHGSMKRWLGDLLLNADGPVSKQQVYEAFCERFGDSRRRTIYLYVAQAKKSAKFLGFKLTEKAGKLTITKPKKGGAK